MHIKSFQESKELDKCLICGNGYSTKGMLKIHIESVNEKKKSQKHLLCDYCCSRKDVLEKHIESIHKNKEIHKCSICKNKFSNKGILKNLIGSIHHSVSEWILIKSQDRSQRLLQADRGPPRDSKNRVLKSPTSGRSNKILQSSCGLVLYPIFPVTKTIGSLNQK